MNAKPSSIWRPALAGALLSLITVILIGLNAPAASAILCSLGSLTITVPATVTFPGLTLNGSDQTTSTMIQLTADDETSVLGSSPGWNITATSTTLTNANSQTLSTTATKITAASATAGPGNCRLPTNSVSYPITLPAAATPPTAVKVFNAAANTGAGPTLVTLTSQIAVPANSYKGTYTSTWTITIASGP
jgi:hypothetical protein